MVPAQDLDPLARQSGSDVLGEDPRLLRNQLPGPVEDGGVHLPRHHAGDGRHRNTCGDPAFQPGDPDHVELVEIGGEDRQEPCAFQQRHPEAVLRQVEDAVVEGEPRQLTIKETVGRQLGGRFRRPVDRDVGRPVGQARRDVDCFHPSASSRRGVH
jgi:hypothetical protein